MSPISFQNIQTVVSRAAGPNAKIVSHRVEPFSKRRHGIMGNHYELAVDVDDNQTSSGSVRTLKFFVKTPPDSPIMRDKIVDKWVSLEEVHFFDEVYPRMMQDYHGERWSPVCYLAKQEALVFEDLRSQGFAIRRDSIFNEDALKSALDTLARFHAASVVAETRLGKPLSEAYPNAFCEKIYTDVGKGGRCNKLGFETMELLAKRFDLDGGIVSKILNQLYEIVKPNAGECNVVCHGDLWRSNIMFDDSAISPKCILVDYQMLRYASPTVDVAMLLYVHTTSEFRRNSELKMLEHYYSVFRETLLQSKVDLKIPSYESILRAYEERRLVGMAYESMKWPAFVFANILDDPVELEKWYFHNRIDIYEAIMNKDPAYENKMRDYLKELFDEGKRILNLQ